MKKSILSVILSASLLIAAGCESTHTEARKEISDRWNNTRIQMTVNLARQQFDSGQLELAARTAQQAVTINPDHIPAYFLLGQIHLEQGYLGPAQKDLQKCLELDPDHADAKYTLGIIYERRGLMKEAWRCYEAAWQAHPERSSYVLAVAEMCAGRKEFEKALEVLMEYISGSTHGEPDPSVYLAAGNIQMILDKPDEAVPLFRSACNLVPDDTRLNETLAYALLEAGHYDEAVLLFERLRKIAEKQEEKISWAQALAMGDCYMKLGRYHKAQRSYQYVCDETPANPDVWVRLARSALARGDFSRAGTWARKGLALENTSLDARMVLGFVAYREGKYRTVEQYMNEVIEADGKNSVAWCLLGQTREALGETDKAVACYQQALRLDPDDAVARRCLANLENTRIGMNPLSEGR